MAYTTIDNPELYFQVKAYAGTGSEQSITLDGSENMQPDFVWFKNRTITANHALFDSIRGASSNVSSLYDLKGVLDAIQTNTDDLEVKVEWLDSPLCLILDTVKGKGVSFIEDPSWHCKVPTKEEYKIAMKELGV